MTLSAAPCPVSSLVVDAKPANGGVFFGASNGIFLPPNEMPLPDHRAPRPLRGLRGIKPYMEPPEAFSEEFAELVTERTKQLEKIDERRASRFEPGGIAAFLRSHGFSDIEDINFQEIKSRFGRAVQGLADGRVGLHVVHAKH